MEESEAARAFWAKELKNKEDSKIDMDEEEKAMRALWQRQVTSDPTQSTPRYSNLRRCRLSILTPIDNDIPTLVQNPSTSEARDDLVLQILSDILNPFSPFWRWTTPNRFDTIVELLAAFQIGQKEVIATIGATITCYYCILTVLRALVLEFGDTRYP